MRRGNFWRPTHAVSHFSARDRLSRLKHLIVEPREASAFAAARLEFEAKLDGAIVRVCSRMAACRR
jgi:hypothetical protein